jgi:hypothetical protein
MTALTKMLRTPAAPLTGRGIIPSVWRGEIAETYTDGTVAVLIPGLYEDQAVRVPCVVAGPLPGDRVIVGAVEGRKRDLVVIGAYELVRAGYVDAAVATRAPAAHRHPWADLDNIPATFAPIIGSTATTAKAGNYVPAWSEVTGKPTAFAPSAHTHPFTEITGTATPAQIPAATTAAAGSMSATDKLKLDNATFSATGNTLALRHSSGSIQVVTGTTATDAANKAYVDKLGIGRAAGTVAVPVLAAGATTTVTITFPASRFTVAPILTMNTGNGRVTVDASTVTATGATITLCNYTAAASVAATGQWQAVQMTAAAAAG